MTISARAGPNEPTRTLTECAADPQGISLSWTTDDRSRCRVQDDIDHCSPVLSYFHIEALHALTTRQCKDGSDSCLGSRRHRLATKCAVKSKSLMF